MYRIHKLEEKIHNQDLLIGSLQQRINKAIEYINHFSKKSEVKINGLPDCKVFIGDIEQLLEILKGSDVDDNRDMERH